MRGWWAKLAMAATLGVSLGACSAIVPEAPLVTPKLRPAGLAGGAAATPIRPTSEISARLRARFSSIQSAQLSQGLLRRDGGGPDTPFTSAMLARNFVDLAFFNEYAGEGLAPGVAGRLRRWERPISIGLEFGASVPPSQRIRDRADVERYAARLSRITGHPIRTGTPPNFIVAFVSEDDRIPALENIAARLGTISPPDLRRLTRLPTDTYCVVLAFPAPDNPFAYGAAVAIVRAENPDLLRLSCIHEEMAQGLGLANDSPDARPSIFNDDDEFALLTGHDALLLSMLYDPALTPGMSLEDAQDTVNALARNRMGEDDGAT